MVSREQERAAMYNKMQLLRSIINSHAKNMNSIILDASKYITDLKHKVERLNQDISAAETSTTHNSLPVISVEEKENDFLIKVFSEENCQGLLVFILEAFEELGLDVLQARVSSSDNFLLEALAAKKNKEADDQIDEQVVEQGMVQAIENWRK